MGETRIRGQEAVVRISRGAAQETTLTAIKNLTLTLDMATIDQGYLGETTNRKDDIFNGVSGSFEVDHESEDIYLLIDAIKQRAQRSPDFPVQTLSINLAAQLNFPNGDVVRVIVPDMKFDAIPLNIGGRDTYVASTFSFKASDVQFA